MNDLLRKHVLNLLTLVLPLIIFISNCNAAEDKMLKAVDEETGLSFQYPSRFLIHKYDLWFIPTEGITDSFNQIYWDVFNTSFYTGTLKERCLKFASSLAAADGTEGGTIAAGTFIKAVHTKSNDEALLFELHIKGWGNEKDSDGKLGGYLLGVDLKPNDKKKYRHLLLYSPSRDILLKIVESLEIPTAFSMLDPSPPPAPKAILTPFTPNKLYVQRAEYYADKSTHGEIIVEGNYQGMPLPFVRPHKFSITIGKYKKQINLNDTDKLFMTDASIGTRYEYNDLAGDGFYFSLKKEFAQFSLIVHNPKPLEKADFKDSVPIIINVDDTPGEISTTFKVFDSDSRNDAFKVQPSLAALKHSPASKILYHFYKTTNYAVSTDLETQIYSLDTSKGTNQLLFSDLETSIIIGYSCGSGGAGGGLLVTASGRAFAVGIERNSFNITKNLDCPHHQQIYELYLDGSNRYRKVTDYQGGHTLHEIFLSPTGDRIGYFGLRRDPKISEIIIHSTDSGKVTQRIPLKQVEEEKSFFGSAGWLPNGNGLFFNQFPDGEEDPHPKDGGYIVDLLTSKIEKIVLDTESKSMPSKKITHDLPTSPTVVGGLSNGDLIISENSSANYSGFNLKTKRKYFYSEAEPTGCSWVLPLENRLLSCDRGRIRIENDKGNKIEIAIDQPQKEICLHPFRVLGWSF